MSSILIYRIHISGSRYESILHNGTLAINLVTSFKILKCFTAIIYDRKMRPWYNGSALALVAEGRGFDSGRYLS